jgi:hypothetical protein
MFLNALRGCSRWASAYSISSAVRVPTAALIFHRSAKEHLAADGHDRGMQGLKQWAATMLIAAQRAEQVRKHEKTKFEINAIMPQAPGGDAEEENLGQQHDGGGGDEDERGWEMETFEDD